jgi:hypothetical protein
LQEKNSEQLRTIINIFSDGVPLMLSSITVNSKRQTERLWLTIALSVGAGPTGADGNTIMATTAFAANTTGAI